MLAVVIVLFFAVGGKHPMMEDDGKTACRTGMWLADMPPEGAAAGTAEAAEGTGAAVPARRHWHVGHFAVCLSTFSAHGRPQSVPHPGVWHPHRVDQARHHRSLQQLCPQGLKRRLRRLTSQQYSCPVDRLVVVFHEGALHPLR